MRTKQKTNMQNAQAFVPTSAQPATATSQHWVNCSDGEQLFVQCWGDEYNPPMVLVHDYPDNQDVWALVIPYLIQDFYVISYDVRGAGRSSVPKKLSSYRLAQLSADLNAVTAQVIPHRAFHLAAHDWGSIQSWESVTEPSFQGKILSYSTISGPCLDHAYSYLQKAMRLQPIHALKMLGKSWYIGLFHLPFLAPSYWRLSSVQRWQKLLTQLERQDHLPASTLVTQDSRQGIALYRANFMATLRHPRARYAQCPVQAIVLKRDRFVSAEYIDEMPYWVKDFSRVEVDANHWAILSQPKEIAAYIRAFALKHQS